MTDRQQVAYATYLDSLSDEQLIAEGQAVCEKWLTKNDPNLTQFWSDRNDITTDKCKERGLEESDPG